MQGPQVLGWGAPGLCGVPRSWGILACAGFPGPGVGGSGSVWGPQVLGVWSVQGPQVLEEGVLG